jgi:hypothetical protein
LKFRPGELGLLPPDSTATKEEVSWWRDNLYQNIRRTISDGVGGIPATLLSVLSLLAIPGIAVITSARSLPALYEALLIILMTGGFAYSLVVGISYTAYVALRALPPKKYAKLVLSGRNETDVLRTMAWEIRSACHLFEEATATLHGVFTQAEVRAMRRKPDLVSTALHKVRTLVGLSDALDQLRANRLAHEMALQRLFALKAEVARLIGISPRRFCDHIVQYSPRRQARALGKFVANWDYVLRAACGGAPSDTAKLRVVSLLLENERFMTSTQLTIESQKDLFDYSDLHHDLCTIASSASASNATLGYAKGVSRIASAALSAEKGDIDYARAERRLQFLYRGQHSRAGLEPHMCLTQLCKVIVEHPSLSARLPGTGGIPSLASIQVEVLDGIAAGLSLKGRSPEPLAISETALRNLDALRELEFSAETYFDWSRTEIAERFSVAATDWLLRHPVGTASAIVTCGLSKTVRGCLNVGLTRAVAAANSVRPGAKLERPEIFLLSTAYDDDIEAQDMLAELRSDPEHPNSVSIGSPRQVADVTMSCQQVLLVLGLDTFSDLGPSRGVQVLHSPATSAQVAEFLKLLSDAELEHSVIFVAGGYKAHVAPLYYQQRLLQFHLRHVALFRSGCSLITDGRTINASQKGGREVSSIPRLDKTTPSVGSPRSGAFVDGAWIKSG